MDRLHVVKRFFLIFLLSVTVCFQPCAARVSVLTCSPGEEAYSLFGHTGLRYCDSDRGIDVVFNYGYFSFNAPNFIWRFILGETDYMVGAVTYDIFVREYMERGSAVTEQVLSLTPEQEQALFALLLENCGPENCVYRYNYFYNNCTTKIRDKVFSVNQPSFEGERDGVTFRDELSRMLASHPWYSFGINLLLGSDVDCCASRSDLQFIPGNFMDDLGNAWTIDCVGKKIPFVKETETSVAGVERLCKRNNFTPFNASLLLLLFTLIVMLCEVRRRTVFWWYDVVLMLLQGLSGALLLFMALFSEHPAVDSNWLILLLNPVALLLIPVLVYQAVKRVPVTVVWVQVFFIAAFLLTAVLSLQVYPTPIYFCALALLARSLFHIYKEKICELGL